MKRASNKQALRELNPLRKVIERCRADLPPEFDAELAPTCVRVTRRGDSIAAISPGLAGVFLAPAADLRQLHADFTVDGPHWDDLNRLLRKSRVGRAPRQLPAAIAPAGRLRKELPDPTTAIIIDRPPNSAGPRQIAEMIVDSRRLRQERIRAFGLVVELTLTHDQLRREIIRLYPVRRNGNFPELPFEYEFDDGDRHLSGALRLQSTCEPLSIALYGTDAAFASYLRPWQLVLAASAQLLCEESSRREPEEDGGEWVPPESWIPYAQTAEWTRRHVPGHLRRLTNGAASDEQRRLARQIGIDLPASGCTWVRPHLNGLPPDSVLAFAWTPTLARG